MLNVNRIPAMIALVILSALIIAIQLEAGQEYSLKEDLSIGIDIGDENLMFGRISDVSLDAGQNIYVLDSKNVQIKKFDPEGRFLQVKQIGRGQGPHEITQPSTLAITPNGKIFLLDFGAKKVIVFDADLEFKKSIQLAYQLTHSVPYGHDEIAVLGFKDDNLIRIYDADGKMKKAFGNAFEVPSKLAQYKDMPLLKAPMRFSGAEGKRLFVLNPHKYEIDLYEDGKLVRTIKGKNRLFQPLRAPNPQAKRMAIIFPWVHVLEHRERMYVWINLVGPDVMHQLEIFEDYESVASVELMGTAHAIDRQGRIYCSEADEFPRVVRYRVVQH
jgi:hypothetical protein